NDPNDVISPTIRVTTANTRPLAANTTPRRGWTASEVRIIPVEYSEVMVSAPSAAMTSWPTYRPARLCWVPSKPAGLIPWGCDAVPTQATVPMRTRIGGSRVQYGGRAERILVNPDRSASANPARPVSGGSRRERAAGAIWAVVISRHSRRVHAVGSARLLLAGCVGLELHAVRGQFHERLLQGGLRGCQFVQPDRVLEGQVPDPVRRQPLRHEDAGGTGHGGPASRGDEVGQQFRLGRPDSDRLDRVALDELGHGAIGDEPATADDQQVVGRVLHFRHKVAGHEDGAPFGGERLHEVADPQDPLGVQAVGRLVEHE